jgi:hypothetical protein
MSILTDSLRVLMGIENRPRPDGPGSGYWILGILLSLVLFNSCTSAEPADPAPPIIEETSTRELITPSPVKSQQPAENTPTVESSLTPSAIPTADDISPPSDQAEVLEVKVSGEAGVYNFSVTISSPDEGCNQYADWWEVISQDGELFYRRILLHSHVNEQPFTRSGGPVAIEADTIVLVRAHMNSGGYGSLAMQGSLEGGFEQVELSDDFAADLGETPPLPEGCNF